MVIISDGGSHFHKKLFKTLLKKYGVGYNVVSPYHPQTSGQVEVSDREIKTTLAETVNTNRWIGRGRFNMLYGITLIYLRVSYIYFSILTCIWEVLPFITRARARSCVGNEEA